MTRARLLVVLALAFSVGVVAFTFGRGAAADGASGKRLVYLYVSGKGPQAKAWYDGGPPQGVQIQTALDKWASDGYHFAALTQGPVTTVSTSSTPLSSNDSLPAADFVLLLER